MKKLFVLLIAPLAIFSALQAQTTQQQADAIALEHMDAETRPYSLYAKEGLQPAGTTIATSNGEVIELDYESWVYYVLYTDNPQGRYLIIKEDNGNLLEVNVKDDEGPDGLGEWRFVFGYPIEIPFDEYSLEGTTCQWINLDYDKTVIIINSEGELGNYVSCTDDIYPEIDFSEYTLLLASGSTSHTICNVYKKLQRLSYNKYELNIEIQLTIHDIAEEWIVAMIVKKLNKERQVELNVTCQSDYSLSGTLCLWTNLTYYGSIYHPHPPDLVRINSNEELDEYISCAEGSYPEIDFTKYTLLLVSGSSMDWERAVIHVDKNLQQLSENEYKLNIEVLLSETWQIVECWSFAIIINKMDEESNIELSTTYTIMPCRITNSYPHSGKLTIINSKEELENHISCTDGNESKIDFSKHTLLLTSGAAYTYTWSIHSQLVKTGENSYDLDITVLNIDITYPTCWIAKILIAKLSPDAAISLNVYYPYGD